MVQARDTILIRHNTPTVSKVLPHCAIMMNVATAVLLAACSMLVVAPVSGFQIGQRASALSLSGLSVRAPGTTINVNPKVSCDKNYYFPQSSTSSLYAASDDDGGNEEGMFNGVDINPTYLVPYVGFLLFGFYMTSTEAAGASQLILEKFIADPLNPGVNELFATVFNLIGLVGIPLACIIMPSAKGQKFPAPPFLIASAAVGYGAVGPYVMTRKPVTSVAIDDLGWVTKSVLENKAFNWFMVIVAMSSLFTTGLLNALASDFSGTVQGYWDIFSSTAIAGVSSVDFAILCMTAASLIPEDLERRGMTDKSKANLIAVSTLLLPMIGATIYCALRPPLPLSDDQ